MHSLRNSTEKFAMASLFCTVSEARTNKFDIFRQCTHILYASSFKKNEDAKLDYIYLKCTSMIIQQNNTLKYFWSKIP